MLLGLGRNVTKLKKVISNLMTWDSCNDSYRSDIGQPLPWGILPESMICTHSDNVKLRDSEHIICAVS